MLVHRGIFTPIPMSIFWNPYNVGLPVGLPIVGENPLSYCWNKSSDDCMQELNWPTIKQHHKYFSICHVHDSLHHRSSLPFHNHFQLPETTTRSHPLSIRPIVSTINSYRFSFFCKQPFFFGTSYHIPSYRLRSQIYSVFPFAAFYSSNFLFFVLLCIALLLAICLV